MLFSVLCAFASAAVVKSDQLLLQEVDALAEAVGSSESESTDHVSQSLLAKLLPFVKQADGFQVKMPGSLRVNPAVAHASPAVHAATVADTVVAREDGSEAQVQQHPTPPAASVRAGGARMAEEATAKGSTFQKFSDFFSNLFPVWTAAVAAQGLMNPAGPLSAIPTSYFTGLLGLLMLSMGITLTVDDFKAVMKRPGVLGLGFACCYVLMPLMALGLSNLLGLSGPMTAGMVLVGSINGGQASNLCTYIAKGDVALSVMMTTCTTLGAIVMTPLLCKVLLGALVPVNALGVALSTVQVVLVPIVLGMLLNAKFPETIKKILPFAPIVGVASTCILVGAAVASCAPAIMAAGAPLQIAAALLHIIGGIFAYALCKPMGYDEQTCRTFAIETSMKSSAFGFLLAKLHFADPLVAVPAAVSVVWMALCGSSLAVLFRALGTPKPQGGTPAVA